MEESDANNKKGVVNHGFSVDFSSEEDVSDVDISYSTFTPKDAASRNFDSATKTEVTTTSINANKPKDNLTHADASHSQHQETLGNNNVAENKGQSFLSASAKPGLSATENQKQSHKSSVDKNVQTSSMLPANSVLRAEAASLIPNGTHGKNLSSEIKKSNLNHFIEESTKERRHSKEYFRDVRLSLDASKPISTASGDGAGGLPFHSNISKSYSIQSSYKNTSDSSCDDCVRKALEQYRTILKYVIQRPLFCFSLWAMLYIFWGDDALPGGSLFALTILELSALFLAYVAELCQLPGLLGMVAAGLILRNVPYIDVAKDLEFSVSSPLRVVSIVILLVRGALGVNPVNIVKFKNIIPPLVIGPCVLEAIAASVAVYFILDFPVEWASLMGCIISAMSGVAVLPYLASTEKLLSGKVDPSSLSPHYQSVITIARTSCGLDAMIAICMAEVALGFIFAEGDVGMGIVKGAVEVIMGGVFGVIWGLLAGFLLDETTSSDKRSMTIFSCGVMSLLGFPKIGYPRAGPLAVFAGVLITSTIWKKKKVGGSNNEQLSATYTLLWYIFQPLLFGIIGARTDFDRVDWSVIWKGLICIIISLLVRLIAVFTATTLAGKFSLRERLYLCLSWIPKGTVQAALAPAAADTMVSIANLKSPSEYEDLGYKVMNISVLSFIAAALLGCLCLRFIGPRLLVKH